MTRRLPPSGAPASATARRCRSFFKSLASSTSATSPTRPKAPAPASAAVRVALNAHFLHQPQTGSGQYLSHLLRAYPRIGGGESIPFCDGTPPAPPGGWPGGFAPVLGRTPFDRAGRAGRAGGDL